MGHRARVHIDWVHTYIHCRVTSVVGGLAGVQGASTDRRSIRHGIVREDIKEREVESLIMQCFA